MQNIIDELNHYFRRSVQTPQNINWQDAFEVLKDVFDKLSALAHEKPITNFQKKYIVLSTFAFCKKNIANNNRVNNFRLRFLWDNSYQLKKMLSVIKENGELLIPNSSNYYLSKEQLSEYKEIISNYDKTSLQEIYHRLNIAFTNFRNLGAEKIPALHTVPLVTKQHAGMFDSLEI